MSDEQNRNPQGAGLGAAEKMGFTTGEPAGKLPGVVSLKSYLGKYLSAQTDGRLEWNRDWERDWELFKLEPLNGGKVAFKSFHGRYISVKGDGTVMCDQRAAGENEAWMVERAGNGITIKSSSGKYLHPEKDGRVTATRDAFTGEEIFTATDHSPEVPSVKLPGVASLKSYQNKYLSAWYDGRLDWEREWDQSWEQFKLEPLNGDKVAFKSCHGLYISVKGDGTVMCDQRAAGENEAWTVEWAGSGIAIKSRSGKYLYPEKDGKVTATRDVVTKEEIFTLTAHG